MEPEPTIISLERQEILDAIDMLFTSLDIDISPAIKKHEGYLERIGKSVGQIADMQNEKTIGSQDYLPQDTGTKERIELFCQSVFGDKSIPDTPIDLKKTKQAIVGRINAFFDESQETDSSLDAILAIFAKTQEAFKENSSIRYRIKKEIIKAQRDAEIYARQKGSFEIPERVTAVSGTLLFRFINKLGHLGEVCTDEVAEVDNSDKKALIEFQMAKQKLEDIVNELRHKIVEDDALKYRYQEEFELQPEV